MLNQIVIHGRLTRDPELRRTQTGKAVTQFCVAVDRDTKNSDGSRTADFIDCVAWQELAEFVQRYFQKGQEAIVAGRLGSREWVDKDGQKHRAWEILANKIEFCGPKDGQASGTRQQATGDEGTRIATEPSAPRNDSEGSGQRQAPRRADFAELDDDDSELPF